MFFDGWQDLLHIIILGICSYAALIIMLRIGGKRMLAQMNMFDLVITIALGSILSSVVIDSNVSLSEGILAISLFLSMQYLIAWSVKRNKAISNLINPEPTLLLLRGHYLIESMRAQNITKDEIDQALRQQGMRDITQAEAVVLEANGNLSVIKNLSS